MSQAAVAAAAKDVGSLNKGTPHGLNSVTTDGTPVRVHGGPQLASMSHMLHTLDPILVPDAHGLAFPLQPLA
jgi:hypothetical protein